MKLAMTLLFSAFVFVLTACPPVDDSTDGGGDLNVGSTDSGGENQDAGVGSDSAGTDRTGTDRSTSTDRAGGRDTAGGVDTSTGGEEYEGEAEEGVVCGGSTCALGVDCCVAIAGSSCDTGGGCTYFGMPCDGPEDCDDGEECCGVEVSSMTYDISCVPAGTCGGKVACTSSADCGGGETCCAENLVPTIDVGYCQSTGC